MVLSVLKLCRILLTHAAKKNEKWINYGRKEEVRRKFRDCTMRIVTFTNNLLNKASLISTEIQFIANNQVISKDNNMFLITFPPSVINSVKIMY